MSGYCCTFGSNVTFTSDGFTVPVGGSVPVTIGITGTTRTYARVSRRIGPLSDIEP